MRNVGAGTSLRASRGYASPQWPSARAASVAERIEAARFVNDVAQRAALAAISGLALPCCSKPRKAAVGPRDRLAILNRNQSEGLVAVGVQTCA
jgi:hypothetical protein